MSPSSSDDPKCQALHALWQERFPIARAMQIEPLTYSASTLTTLTPLVGNTNIHDIAFAGSLYTAQAMTAWGILFLELDDAGIDASIIQASGDIQFAQPVLQDIEAACELEDRSNVFDALLSKGKVRLNLSARVMVNGSTASTFKGDFGLRLNA